MNLKRIVFHILSFITSLVVAFSDFQRSLNMGPTCGRDLAPPKDTVEGTANIEWYPWLGYLIYPVDHKQVLTTPIILITKQLAIGTAMDIENMPKHDFRENAKIILGYNCTGPKIEVREYSYHPEYGKNTISALVIIQLHLNRGIINKQVIRTICPPPKVIMEPEFYAVSLPQDCTNSEITMFKMALVDDNECKSFYRRSGLDIQSVWPKHTACARALTGGPCLWQNGVLLVLRQHSRWSVVGFGVYGPGCQSPARFVDYGMYHQWVLTNLRRIGRPAITRLASNHIIMRRSLLNVQRFGPCDPEETKIEIFTDHTAIRPKIVQLHTAYYNFTLLDGYEYSCIVFRCNKGEQFLLRIHLRRLCFGGRGICYHTTTLKIDFEVRVEYVYNMEYHVNVYGRELKMLDIRRLNLREFQYGKPENVTEFNFSPLTAKGVYV